MIEYQSLVKKISNCTKCTLGHKRTKAVPGEGSLAADVFLIGEAPGYYEDQAGKPFVGRAGQLLDKLLQSIDLSRKDVYITNLLKCRPPNNRDPLPNEIKSCGDYLGKQLEMISPKLIVTLGRYSLTRFLPSNSLSNSRGKLMKYKDIPLFPVYHPAAGLRNGNIMSILKNDFTKIPEIMRSLDGRRDENKQQDSQLNLF
jgi:DNA polymerase